MPKIAGDPLTKITLNLFEADVRYLQEYCGDGYTSFIRDIIKREVKQIKLTTHIAVED